jgi:hypothetical protein
MVYHRINFSKFQGSSFLSPAHGKGGARATIQNVSAPPSALLRQSYEGQAEKIRFVQQAGKKEGGLGEGIFARLLCPPKAGCGVGSGSSLRQQGSKARKN